MIKKQIPQDIPKYLKKMNVIPKSVIAGVDFGYINPSAIVVVAIDSDDNHYVVDELYRSGLTISNLIADGVRLRDKYAVEVFFADPSQPAYIKEMNASGLHTIAAKNDIIPGINAVCEKLKVNSDGRPSLFVSKRCKNLIRELENYRYLTKGGAAESMTEVPVKCDDHACDALRYAVYSMKCIFKPKSFKPKWL